jgi:FkbM family methyltransferase
MPLIVRTPANPAAIATTGPYPRALNVLSRQQTAVQRQLRRSGLAGYEAATQATLLSVMQQAPHGAAFFDVGAHIGLYAALIGTVFAGKGVRSYAFESAPETAAICRAVAVHNRLRIEVVEAAVSDEPGTAPLFGSDTTESSNSLNGGFRAHSQRLSVPVTTLDLFTAESGVVPTLIKIDVETHEPQALRGARKLIERDRPWIVCEIVRGADQDAMAAALGELAELGYTFHCMAGPAPWHSAPADAHHTLFGLGGRDWLLAPEPLSESFYATVRGWRTAIAACTERTNTLVPGGRPLPPRWDAPHRARRLAWLTELIRRAPLLPSR